MKEILQKFLYMFIGFIICLSFFLLISASWKPLMTQGSSTVSITCSNDGGIVYVTDMEGVKKSSDGGKTWEIVLQK